ncbi:hypothetical protein BKA61DRAFT_741252 [Leptodontidium sp. MPI-SDFR-AT-0119]|nr:hypothetical protein BKA61DRAFT_741252 [Leptodontidium sp. MPI-SDFR-AT-0119]
MKDSSAPPKIYLQENVGGGRGRHTTISVLDPYIRIERTDDNQYRIIATFKLQVKIHAFEKGYMRRCEKLFDFVSLRYLYYDLERHKVHPAGDAIARLAVTEENTTTKGFKAGLTGDATMGVVPTAEVSVESDNTLTYERKTKSWRRGFSYEPYAKCDHKWDPAERKGQHPNRSCCQNLEPKCEPGASCGYRDPSGKAARRYDRCAHWFWQTEAAAHLWTPEIYESFSETITIARLIPVDIIGEALNEGQNQEKLHQYLHFDFVVTCRLRELGWSFKDYWKRPTKPTEIRAKGDYGYPLATDRVAFCVCCCADDVRNFPSRPTRALQREAEKEVDEHGPTVRYLPRTKEWKQKRRERKHQDDEKDKKEAQLEEMKRRLTDMELRARLDRIDRELHNKPCNSQRNMRTATVELKGTTKINLAIAARIPDLRKQSQGMIMNDIAAIAVPKGDAAAVLFLPVSHQNAKPLKHHEDGRG